MGVNGAFAGSIPENTGAHRQGRGTHRAGPQPHLPALAWPCLGGPRVAIAPALVTEPAPEDGAPRPEPLDGTARGQLQCSWAWSSPRARQTVLKGAPGGVVRGKTGTAEHGTKNPPETHAWFVGYQGDVAFAVLVEAGKSGGTVAAPVAKDFLTGLAR